MISKFGNKSEYSYLSCIIYQWGLSWSTVTSNIINKIWWLIIRNSDMMWFQIWFYCHFKFARFNKLGQLYVQHYITLEYKSLIIYNWIVIIIQLIGASRCHKEFMLLVGLISGTTWALILCQTSKASIK